MSTSKSKKQKDKPKLIMCKNCHQDILKDKMFLHEGFCIRNNIYCEHCERVFLKKDYEDHIKTIPKNLSKNKNDTQSQSQKSPETRSESGRPNSTTDYNDSINNFNDNNEPLYPMPSLEFVQMPPTELFHINKPIIIADGKIVSNKNKNEFLLPYLGINTFQPSQKSEEVINEIINQGDIFEENNNICISRNSYRIEDLEKILNKENINFSNKLNNNENKQNMRESNQSNYSGNQMNNNKNLKLSKKIKEYHQNRNNKSISFINDINENNQIKKTFEREKESKNFITKNVDKINEFFNQEETPKNPQMTYSLKNKTLNNLNNNDFEPIPLDKKSIKSYHIQLSNGNNIDNYSSNNVNISGNKEPKDSNSKRNQTYQSSGKKIPMNASFKPQSEKGKSKMSLKRCQYCNNAFNQNDANNHYKICKMKKENKKKVRKFDIPKPKNREKYLMEIFPLENIDENGLDDKKRATLKRKFNAALNVISLNNDTNTNINRGVISNPDRKYKNDIIIKENKKISLKKNLFHFNDENSQLFQNVKKKDFPEDSNRIEKASKTQKRMYRMKRNNNLSVDGNNIDLFNNSIRDIKIQRKAVQPILNNVYKTYNIDNTEIDPWLYFYDNLNINKNKH